MFFNVVFLVLLFFIYAIQFASIYKFFRYKYFMRAILLFVFSCMVLVLTISYFFTRHALIFNEIHWFIEGIKHCKLYAILFVILNVFLTISSFSSYLTIVKMSKKESIISKN